MIFLIDAWNKTNRIPTFTQFLDTNIQQTKHIFHSIRPLLITTMISSDYNAKKSSKQW